MILKSPQKKVRCIDETILDNKILIIGFVMQGGFESFAYTISLQAVLDYVRSIREVVPETVDQLVIHAGRILDSFRGFFRPRRRTLSEFPDDFVPVFIQGRLGTMRSDGLDKFDASFFVQSKVFPSGSLGDSDEFRDFRKGFVVGMEPKHLETLTNSRIRMMESQIMKRLFFFCSIITTEHGDVLVKKG